jgi:hypothetical protein
VWPTEWTPVSSGITATRGVLTRVTGDSAEFLVWVRGRLSTVLILVKAEAASQRYNANPHDTLDLRPPGFARTDDCP